MKRKLFYPSYSKFQEPIWAIYLPSILNRMHSASAKNPLLSSFLNNTILCSLLRTWFCSEFMYFSSLYKWIGPFVIDGAILISVYIYKMYCFNNYKSLSYRESFTICHLESQVFIPINSRYANAQLDIPRNIDKT